MQYELMYIVPTSFTDEDVGKIEGNIKTLLEKHGAKIIEAQRLGKFKFAYPIKKQRHGHYMLIQLEAEPTSLMKLDEGLRISNEVLRHLLLKADEAGGNKFDIVQFTEVNVEMKDDRPRRKREEKEGGEKVEEVVKIEEASTEVATPEVVAPAASLSDEELDKKLTAALEGDVKTV